MKPDNLSTIFISGKSCEQVLLQCAIYWAETGERVWFISPKPFSTLPQLLKKPPNKEILKLILFLYIPEINDLLVKLSEFHLLPKMPKVIIVMETEYFWFPPNKDLSHAATVTAFLSDALSSYITKNCDRAFLIAASDLPVTNTKLRTILDLYFATSVFYTDAENSDVFDKVVERFTEKYK